MIETLLKGGWPMAALAICSIAAVTLIIERAIALRRKRVIDSRVLAVIDNYHGETSAENAMLACRRAPGAFAHVVREIIETRRLDHAQAIETMHAVGRTQVARLERGLTVMEIIANVAPLIGLLGTVLGMLTVFSAIHQEGLDNPQVLSDGIAQALVTTVAGLCVAIPALAAHGIYSKRVDELAVEMQDRATSFIVKLQGLR